MTAGGQSIASHALSIRSYPQWYGRFGIEADIGEGPFIQGLKNKGLDAAAIMNDLWNSWLTFADLKRVKDAGITHLRIPVS